MPVPCPRLARVLAPLALLVALAAAPGDARADDRTRAAEHFALAQSAEKRQDWRAAIEEYEQAYQLSPHPSVLYNIALNQERLGDWRAAARAFLRYLDRAGDAAEDREAVLARVRGLREKPSKVTVVTRPPGAAVSVDGEERGAAPLTVTLEGGKTARIVAEHEGRRSAPRQVAPEYGDALSITIDLDAAPGLLQVDANVRGAEVRLDGQLIGHTPYAGEVSSGEHQLTVALAGHRAVQRTITVPARGSEQVRAQLERLPGAAPVEQPEEGGGRGTVLVGSNAYGYHAGEEGAGARITLNLGLRTLGEHLELGGLVGVVGGMLAVGAEGKLYLLTGNLRPYARGAVMVGRHGSDRATAVEAGGGVLLVSRQVRSAGRSASLELYLEVSVHRRSVDEMMLLDPLEEEEEADATSTAIVFGYGGTFGR